MFGARPGDDRCDARRLDLPAVLVMVVGAIGEHCVRLMPGTTTATRTDGMAWIRGMGWVTSLWLPPVSDTCNGVACPSVVRWCFEPVRARSTGLGLVLGHLSSPARASRPPPPAASPAPRRRAARPAGFRAAESRPQRCSSPAITARRSCPCGTHDRANAHTGALLARLRTDKPDLFGQQSGFRALVVLGGEPSAAPDRRANSGEQSQPRHRQR